MCVCVCVDLPRRSLLPYPSHALPPFSFHIPLVAQRRSFLRFFSAVVRRAPSLSSLCRSVCVWLDDSFCVHLHIYLSIYVCVCIRFSSMHEIKECRACACVRLSLCTSVGKGACLANIDHPPPSPTSSLVCIFLLLIPSVCRLPCVCLVAQDCGLHTHTHARFSPLTIRMQAATYNARVCVGKACMKHNSFPHDPPSSSSSPLLSPFHCVSLSVRLCGGMASFFFGLLRAVFSCLCTCVGAAYDATSSSMSAWMASWACIFHVQLNPPIHPSIPVSGEIHVHGHRRKSQRCRRGTRGGVPLPPPHPPSPLLLVGLCMRVCLSVLVSVDTPHPYRCFIYAFWFGLVVRACVRRW